MFWLHVNKSVHHVPVVPIKARRWRHPQGLELQLGAAMWMLEIEFGSSQRADSALNN